MTKIRKNHSVKDEIHALREIEKKLLVVEKSRRQIERQLIHEMRASRSTFRTEHGTLKFLGTYMRARLRRQRFLYSTLVAIAVVLVWSGVWTLAERYISNPLSSIGIGLFILWLVRYYMH